MSDAPPTQISLDHPIAVTLTVGQWRAVLDALADAPLSFRRTAPLIGAIEQQANRGISMAAGRGNGVAAEDRTDVG